MNAVIARARDAIERERMQPDLNRAARCTVAFMAPVLVAQWWHLPFEASLAAIAAQNVAIVDVRGSYPLRLGLLLAMTLVLSAAGWLGSMTGDHLPLALGAVVLLMLVGGLWRHLNAEYGPSLATASMLIFLIAVARPAGDSVSSQRFLAVLAGGLWGVLVQGALWPFRAQHPLRRTVADSWLALSDLIAAMTPEANPHGSARHQLIAERQGQLRTALDQATATLTAAHARRKRPYLGQLEELNLTAARLATRFVAFNASLETLMERADFPALAPSFDPVIVSLTNTARTIALTVVSRQPSHLAACEVRLKRLGNLLQALQDRVMTQTAKAAEGAQVTFILRQVSGLLPAAHDALRATIERSDEKAAFPLELFDLQTWTLRPLASALNLRWHPEAGLVRFIARATVLQLLGVAAFKLSHLDRGYWLPLTILVVLQPEYGATRLRARQRVIGTLAGSLLASALLWLALPYAVVMTALAITIAGFAFWLKRNYAVAVFFITLFVVLITEISSRVTIAFTLERLAATAIGGVLALVAAHLFWPVWERRRLPALLGKALRANRDYLRLLAERVAAGGGYDAIAIAAKRAAELANADAFGSLQRMSADPKSQQAGLEQAAALANGNQRFTQALTVVAVHLQAGTALHRTDLGQFATAGIETLEALATAVETEKQDAARMTALRTILDQLVLPAPAGAASALEHCVYGQYTRCATELSAMLLAAEAAHAESTPPFPVSALTSAT